MYIGTGLALPAARNRVWFNDRKYALLCAVADFRSARFALPKLDGSSNPILTKTNGVYPKRKATFDEWFAYTATSTTARTYTASDGTIKNDLAANAPRYTWVNGKRQLRLEDARTNLLARSGNIAFAPTWVFTTGAFTSGAIAAPDGTMAGDMYTSPNTVNQAVYQTGITVTASTQYTFSFYVRLGTMAAAGFKIAVYDVTGAAFIASDVVPSVTPTSTGWTRVTYTFTTPVGCVSARVYPFRNTAAVAGTVYLWGAQLEQGAFASDYIPTTTAAVTRAIETARMSPLIEAIIARAGVSAVLRAQNISIPGSPSSAYLIGVGSTGAALLGFNIAGALVLSRAADQSAITTATPGSSVAGAFGAATGTDASGTSTAANGGAVATAATTVPDRTLAYLGRGGNSNTYGAGFYDFVGISPERLTNAQLQSLAVAA